MCCGVRLSVLRTERFRPPLANTPFCFQCAKVLINRDKRFAFLSNPKTASTTIETWLGRTPGMVCFQGDSKFKHTNFQGFVKLMQAYDEPVHEYEVICIVRHPLDKARSWFRYRSRQAIENNPARYLGNRTFAEYILEILHDHENGTGDVSFLNLKFVCDEHSVVRVDRIFPYHRINAAFEYLRSRLDLRGAVPTKAMNVSPEVDTTLSPELTQAFSKTFAKEIEWYESLD